MGVYLRVKFEVSRIIPTGFRQGVILRTPPPPLLRHESSGSCDSFSVSLNFYLKNTTFQRIVSANDIVLFADEATSAPRKKMMRVFIGYFDEVSKSFTGI